MENAKNTVHKSVLLNEILNSLDIQKGDVILDSTVNGGGMVSELFIRHGEDISLIGIDADKNALSRTQKKFEDLGGRIELLNGNFRDMTSLLEEKGITSVNKVMFDLGLSSDQLDQSERGFSFRRDEPLLMTFKAEVADGDLTASEIVNTWESNEIADLLYELGEENASRRIADAIVTARTKYPIDTTFKLVKVIESVMPRKGKVHPATKTFQALRMAVNGELTAIQQGLESAIQLSKTDGIISVITFHSIEDRIVKQIMRNWVRVGLGELVVKKPIVPTREEILENPRSRSAKLRVFKKY